jgi:signal transduction histidine kinase
MSLTSIEVRTLFHNVHRTWAPAMQRALLDFHVEALSDGLVLLGDANGLMRLLSILLENAAKFTPPGGSVTLTAAYSGTRVVLSVRDTGVGISEEDLPRIFDRFYRAAQTLNAASRGSGLGLALAKWIAERHGTQLTVESRPGQGSCFFFSLEGRALSHLLKSAPSVTIAN